MENIQKSNYIKKKFLNEMLKCYQDWVFVISVKSHFYSDSL